MLARALEDVLAGHSPVRERSGRFVPMMRGLAYMDEMLERSGPTARRDLLRQAPPMYANGEGREVRPAPGAGGRLMAGWEVNWILFDLNGTLLDPSAIAEPLGGRDDDRRLVMEAFHEALLLTMADTLSGGDYRPLPDYLSAALERGLRAAGRDTGSLEEAMRRAAAMDPFPDAERALAVLTDAGMRLGVLTNSTAEAAGRALESAGLRDRFEVVIGSDAVQTFKPQPRVYQHALERLATDADAACLVAAHAWDVMGAMRAGLHGAWVARTERWLLPVVPEPDIRGDDLEDVARKIAERASA